MNKDFKTVKKNINTSVNVKILFVLNSVDTMNLNQLGLLTIIQTGRLRSIQFVDTVT